jgi:hypothetical protein
MQMKQQEQMDEIAKVLFPSFLQQWRLYGKSVIEAIEDNQKVCNHESDWVIYPSNPPQYKCKKCWKFYS